MIELSEFMHCMRMNCSQILPYGLVSIWGSFVSWTSSTGSNPQESGLQSLFQGGNIHSFVDMWTGMIWLATWLLTRIAIGSFFISGIVSKILVVKILLLFLSHVFLKKSPTHHFSIKIFCWPVFSKKSAVAENESHSKTILQNKNTFERWILLCKIFNEENAQNY